jgi:hypothetical protein
MAIPLNPEQEQVVGQAILAGLIRIPDDVVAVGVETIRRQLEAREPASPLQSAEEWIRELHAWMQRNPRNTPELSGEAISRESIYEGRGL